MCSPSLRWGLQGRKEGRGAGRLINMAYLAIVGSSYVNGVAAIHSQILKDDLFKVRLPPSPVPLPQVLHAFFDILSRSAGFAFLQCLL